MLTPRVRRWLRLSLVVGFVALHGSWGPAAAQQPQAFDRLLLGNVRDEKKFTLDVRAPNRNWYPIRVSSWDGPGLYLTPDGNLYVERDLIVYGVKKFARPHPTEPDKLISYAALEGPEAGTYVRGTERLVGGEAIIQLPEHFRLVSAEDRLTVTLTPVGQWLQLYVTEKSAARVVVREAQRRSGRFDYLVQGIRRGYEGYQVVGGAP